MWRVRRARSNRQTRNPVCRQEAQMLTDMKNLDPWTRTITLLSMHDHSEPSVTEHYEVRPALDVTPQTPCSRARPIVRVIDRPTALSVTLDWRDPTECCYREQLWVAARARVSGRCAMSGESIATGDEIFRPRPARPVPRNVGAMILASAVEACSPSVPLAELTYAIPCMEQPALLDLQELLLEVNEPF
jgi:hypothetical protein